MLHIMALCRVRRSTAEVADFVRLLGFRTVGVPSFCRKSASYGRVYRVEGLITPLALSRHKTVHSSGCRTQERALSVSSGVTGSKLEAILLEPRLPNCNAESPQNEESRGEGLEFI